MTEFSPILEIEHLTLRVDHQTIVDDVTVAVPREELVAIVGPSGAGKSSFLRLLNRLTEPSEGRIQLNGRDTREIHLEKETFIAMIRGVVQVVAVGSVLLFLTKQPTWTSTFALMAMLIAATFMGANRVEDIPDVRWVGFLGIGLGAGSVIVR